MYKSNPYGTGPMNPKKNINPHVTAQRNILETAQQAFNEATGWETQILEAAPAGENQPDAVMQIHAPDGKKKTFPVEIKGTLTRATLGFAAEKIRRFEKKGILVTRHVTPPMAERLKAMDIAFLDIAGNAYINDPPIYIYITGRKKVEAPEKQVIGRAFRPTGLRVVFALLCQPELVKAPYRDIVNATRVAQGTVGWVMQDLKQQEYLADRGKHGRKLIHAKKLLDVWVEYYARELRPRLVMGRYGTQKKDWWKTIDWRKTDAALGAEGAAAVLTDYLKPETITVYAPEDVNPFLLKNRLQKDTAGNVAIFKKFWEFEYPWDHKGIAPPLLVYADLIATGNDRNMEAARMIYEKYIHGFIETL